MSPWRWVLCLVVCLPGLGLGALPKPWVPFAICDTQDLAAFPEVHGNRVVWEALTRWGDWDIQGADINNVDVDAIAILTIAGSPQDEWRADIYDSTVVYERQYLGAEDADICYAPTFEENAGGYVIDESYDYSLRPRVWGSRMVWMHRAWDGQDWDILSVDLAEDPMTVVFMPMMTYGHEIYPDLQENHVVWTQVHSEESGRLVSFDLSDGDPNNIVVGMELNPDHPSAVSGDWVVGISPEGRVLADNLADDQGPAIISKSRYCGSVAIADHIVVWHDWRNGHWDIYGYNLATQSEFKIVKSSAGDQMHPAIAACPDGDGYWVVWDDNSDDVLDGDIYGMRINGPQVELPEEPVTSD